MTSLARSTSPVLDAIAALDELRACLLSCKRAAPAAVRMVFHDAHDAITRIQSEIAGTEASVPLSSVEALGVLKARLSGTHDSNLALECGIAASRARSASARIAALNPRIAITSETYLRRLMQFLVALART